MRAKKDTVGLARWDSIHGKNYREMQRNFFAAPIKLGLDLQGGMYVTMEVDIPALLFESAQHEAIDEPFNKVIEATRQEASTSDKPVLDIFLANFDKLARPAGKTLLNYYDLGGGANEVSEEALIQKLTKNIEDAVDQAVEVIRQRIDKYGVSETTIQKVAGRRIVLELPGISDAEAVRSLLQTTARLEFKLVKNDADAVALIRRIDAVLAGKVVDSVKTTKPDTSAAKADSGKAIAKADSGKAKADSGKPDSGNAGKPIAAKKADSTKGTKPDSTKKDSTKADSTKTVDTNDPYKGLPDKEKVEAIRRDHPFSTRMVTYYKRDADAQSEDAFGAFITKQDPPKGEYFFSTNRKGIEELKRMLARPEVKALIPEDRVFAFSAHPEQESKEDPEQSIYGVYVLSAETELTGEVVTDAYPSFNQQDGQPEVIMDMSSDGADKWAEITGANIKKRVAIVLDSAVYSAPTVQTKIDGGRSSISGSKDIKEASLLGIVLKAGALKAPVKIIEERIVGPSLGQDSINQGVSATLFAALLVVLFMIMYYRLGGIVADLAVMLNVLITLAALAAFNATLTLPGIGGLVLTIGMAVDGNILIYERIREEMARGKALKSAVQLGYEKAFTAIIDTHITTLMTGAILFIFGSGPVRGFAVTLMIGILATLFTAVFVTKTVFMVMLERGAQRINFGQAKELSA